MTISTAPPVGLHPQTPPDLVATTLQVDDLSVRGVSFRGTAHELFGDPRQDAFALAANDHWVVLVVSDGIGSSEHSHHGAMAAVTAVAGAVEAGGLDATDAAEVIRIAVEAVCDMAELLAVPTASAATTLTVAAVERTAQDDGSRTAVIHAVGDSPALLLDPTDATWTYVTSCAEGPSNVVRAWVPDRVADHFSVETELPAGAILVVATDGFTTPLGDGAGDLGADLANRWGRGARELFPFVVDLSFNAYHDDKTVVALWNQEVSA